MILMRANTFLGPCTIFPPAAEICVRDWPATSVSTVKAGNFVTFFAQINFFLKNALRQPLNFYW
jgi:hypothetical protein